MLRRNCALAPFAFALFVLAASEATAGQRTFVSGTGVDIGTCPPTAPCRTFGYAIMHTNLGGEVIVLDSAGYGTVTVTQSVSIVAPAGIYAGISVFAGNDGVTVSAGPADKVVLRGLVINGQGGQIGINFASGQILHIHDCIVSNMLNNGIQLQSANSTALVTGTLVRESGQSGIYLQGAQIAVLDGVRAEGNRYGIYARSGPSVTIRNSIALGSYGGPGFTIEGLSGTSAMTVTNSVSSNNFDAGIAAVVAGGGAARLAVEHSVMQDSLTGTRLSGYPLTAVITSNVITRNSTGNDNGPTTKVFTRSDNTVFDNFVSDFTGPPMTPLSAL